MIPRPIKKIFPLAPVPIKIWLLSLYENYKARKMLTSLGYNKDILNKPFILNPKSEKTNVLFYHVSSLSFSGTEKFLQIIAKYLPKEKYTIYYMYSSKKGKVGRKSYLEGHVSFIDFDYDSVDDSYPYAIRGMSPDIFSVISKYEIDLIVTAGSGYSEFPMNMVRDVPIIMLNIFGSPSSQKNILTHLCISKEVASKVEKMIGGEKIEISYILSGLPNESSDEVAQNIRKNLNLKEDDFIFGRIGRADDGIFDPIGITAFKKVVAENQKAHYLIMSPPPILEKIVKEEKIPNVHFLPANADENQIWGFHKAIDALAHFRLDGESCGLNIAESMLCGKPIITHKSHIWNAHLEYLNDEFSRVAGRDNVDQYVKFMKEMIKMKENGNITTMGQAAKAQALKLFSVENNIDHIEKVIENALKTS
jgi:glycosyltransferase involved in cell wall biosynthesis